MPSAFVHSSCIVVASYLTQLNTSTLIVSLLVAYYDKIASFFLTDS